MNADPAEIAEQDLISITIISIVADLAECFLIFLRSLFGDEVGGESFLSLEQVLNFKLFFKLKLFH